ncbi:MAG: DMT family transporter [Alphaproteobacteria bacterium]
MSRSEVVPAPHSRAVLIALFVAMILIWGMNWPIMKIGLQSITPLWFAGLRFGLGALSILVLLLVTRRLVWPTRRDLAVVASVGLFQLAGYVGLVNLGLDLVGAARAAVLAYTTPLWVAPGALLFLGEKLDRWALAGLALGLLGLATLFNPLGFDWTDERFALGNGLILVGAFSWALAILHVRGHRWDSSPLQMMFWQMVLASLVLIPLARGLEGEMALAIDWSAELVVILLYNGPVATAFCFWVAVTVTRALPAVTSSLVFMGVPAVGMLGSALLLGETLAPSLLAGFALIVAGILFVTRRTGSRPSATTVPRQS